MKLTYIVCKFYRRRNQNHRQTNLWNYLQKIWCIFNCVRSLATSHDGLFHYLARGRQPLGGCCPVACCKCAPPPSPYSSDKISSSSSLDFTLIVSKLRSVVLRRRQRPPQYVVFKLSSPFFGFGTSAVALNTNLVSPEVHKIAPEQDSHVQWVTKW